MRELNRVELAALSGSQTAIKTNELYKPIQHASMSTKSKSKPDPSRVGIREQKI